MTDLLNKTDVVVEAVNLDSIDVVSPTMGEIVEMCCGLQEEAPVTTVFTMFVDLVNCMFRRNQRPG